MVLLLISDQDISSHKFVCIGPLCNPIHKSEPISPAITSKGKFCFQNPGSIGPMGTVGDFFFYTDRKLLITGFLEKVVFIEFQLKPKYLF